MKYNGEVTVRKKSMIEDPSEMVEKILMVRNSINLNNKSVMRKIWNSFIAGFFLLLVAVSLNLFWITCPTWMVLIIGLAGLGFLIRMMILEKDLIY